eukprot:250000_1
MRNVVILSGAGVSAESGIPTFRGEGGLWRSHSAFDLATVEAFERDPSLVWQFYHYRRCVVSKCSPNPAHYAITKLQETFINHGRNLDIITQNIDGFHTRAGAQNVIEMHGGLWNVKRANEYNDASVIDDKYVWNVMNMPICKALDGTEQHIDEQNKVKIATKDLPHDSDGNLLRPAVVLFGEQLDRKVMDKCSSLLEKCDMLIILGTSGVVYPAAGFCEVVMHNYNQSHVAEFNLEPSPNSGAFDFVFE